MIIALDTECTGLDLHHDARPYFVTTCDENDEHRNWEWPVDYKTRMPIIPEGDKQAIRELLKRADRIVGQNLKFDVAALKSIGTEFPWEKAEDTIIAGHMLYSARGHSLDKMVGQYLDEDITPFEGKVQEATEECRRLTQRREFYEVYGHWNIAKRGKKGMPSAKEKCWKADMWLPLAIATECEYPPDHWYWTCLEEYAEADSYFTLKLWFAMVEHMKRRDLWEIYRARMEAIPVAWEMEQDSVTGSIERANELGDGFERERIVVVDRCEQIARDQGFPLDMPKSGNNDSLIHFVFKHLRLPIIKMGEKQPSLDKDVIEHYQLYLPDGPGKEFINELATKRRIDMALQYMESYERFWIPTGDGGGKKSWFNIYPSLNPTGTVQLRWSSNNPNCFDGDTELLTTEGWIKGRDVTPEHLVAQYWKDSGAIDFVNPVVQKHHFKGDMHHIKTEDQIDLLLTPNHRCLMQNRKTGTFTDVPANKFYNDYKHYNAGTYSDGNVSLQPEMVALICATQADGSYAKVGGEEYGIIFCFRKKRKQDRLRWALDGLGIQYSEKVKANGDVAFYIGKNEPVVKELKELMPNKRFGSFLLVYDRTTLDLFCDEFFLWDGESVGSSAYFSSLKQNSDWVQVVWCLSNWRANLVSRPPTKNHNKDFHYLNVTRRKPYTLTTNFTRELVPWDDWVYCVTVPSSYIVVRRNGRVSMTGNSQNISKQEGYNLRYIFGPLSGREWWSLDAQNIELRIPAFVSGEPELVNVFLRPKDPPYFGSYHLVVFDLLHPEKFAVHGKDSKDVYDSTWYQWVKNGNFAFIYGAQKRKADATYHVPGAYDLMRDKFPLLAKLSDKQFHLAKANGWVETLPDKTVNPNKGFPIQASRTDTGVLPTTPLNYFVSGSAMWWTQKGMVRCHRQLKEWKRKKVTHAHIKMQVHDEMVFDFPLSKDDPATDLKHEKQYGGHLPDLRDYRSNLGLVRVLQRRMEEGGLDIGVPTPVGCEYNRDNWATITLKC